MRTRESGFTLLEMIIVIGVLSVLVGAAMPVARKALDYRRMADTRAELGVLSAACQEYFRDTGLIPDGTEELLLQPPGVPTWSGPYLPGALDDAITGLSEYAVDGWSQPYGFEEEGGVLVLASGGPDRGLGDEGDIELTVDFTPIRREQTLQQLAILNNAVLGYNALYQATDPLPGSFPSALVKLVSRGYLPTAEGYEVDAWGAPFEGDPPGLSPIVRIRSASLGSD